MRISDWSSDVCSSDLRHVLAACISVSKGNRANPGREGGRQIMSDKVSGRVKWKRMAVLAALAASSTAAANTPERSFGVWSNPKGSVHVRAETCGDRMCGIVVWANDKADRKSTRLNSSHYYASRMPPSA